MDSDNDRVQVFSVLDGVLLRVLGEGEGSGVDQLSYPCGVIVCNDREVIVSDEGNHRLRVFDLYAGHHLRSVGAGKGSGEDQFYFPLGLHVVADMEGEPYVLKE